MRYSEWELEYSHRDHLKWGWDDGCFNDPTSGKFHVTVGSTTRPVGTLRQEVIASCKLMADWFTKPLLIGLSGGSDSQVACLAFRELKFPFTPLIQEFTSESGETYNPHDIANALAFCEKFGLTPRVERLRIDRFAQTRYPELLKEHGFVGTVMPVHLNVLDRYPDHAHLIAGEIRVSPLTVGGPLTYAVRTPIQQHFIKHRLQGIDRFYHYTPELMLAYLDNPIMRAYRRAAPALTPHFQQVAPPERWWIQFPLYYKPMFIIDAFPELIIAPKYTGFERLRYFDDILKESDRAIEAKHPRNRAIIPIEELVTHLAHGNGASKTWTAE